MFNMHEVEFIEVLNHHHHHIHVSCISGKEKSDDGAKNAALNQVKKIFKHVQVIRRFFDASSI